MKKVIESISNSIYGRVSLVQTTIFCLRKSEERRVGKEYYVRVCEMNVNKKKLDK